MTFETASTQKKESINNSVFINPIEEYTKYLNSGDDLPEYLDYLKGFHFGLLEENDKFFDENEPKNVMILDEKSIEWLKQNMDLLREKKLIGSSNIGFIIDILTKDEKIFEVIKNIQGYTAEKIVDFGLIQTAEYLEPEIFNNPKIGFEVVDFVRSEFEYVSALFFEKGKRLNLKDLEQEWPKDILEELKKNLTLLERYRLVSEFNYMYKILLEPRHDPRTGTIRYDSLRKYIIKNPEIFSSKTLSKLLNCKLSEEDRVSVLASLLDSKDEVPVFLQNDNVKGPVAMINNFRGYCSCPQTEERLYKEMEMIESDILRLNFPDGTYALLAFKYREVTIAACLFSNNEMFEYGWSYFPVGDTYKWVTESMKKGFHEETFEEGDKLKQIWSKNRRIEYFYEKTWDHLVNIGYDYQSGKAWIDDKLPDDRYAQYDEEKSPKRSGMGKRV